MHGKSGSHGHRCMLAQTDDNVVSTVCNNDEGVGNSASATLMYFYFDGEQIKSLSASHSGKCVQCGDSGTDSASSVTMATCSGSNVHQQW